MSPVLPDLGSVRAVFLAAQLFQRVENRTENVGLVIRDFGVGEILETFGALNDGGDALEAHAGVHVPGGQRRKGAVGIRIELDENEVPDFDATGIAFVHQAALGIASGREVDVQFGARAAGAGVAHHPEIVLLAAINDVDGGIEPGGAEFFRPAIPRLLVALGRVALGFVGIVNRGVKALRRKFPYCRRPVPMPSRSLPF